MQDTRHKLENVLLLAGSLAALSLLLYAGYDETFRADWHRHQREYKHQLRLAATTDRMRQAAERFDVSPKQLYLPHLNRIDRCTTCHVSIDNPAMIQASPPLTAHPGQVMQDHPKEQFGCTICHDGQGRATTAAEAHGHTGHWPEPLLARKELDRSCPKCHLDRMLPNVPRYNAAMDLFYEHGCLSCHRLRGRGGDIAADISNAGEVHDAEWHFKHFKDPKSVVSTSEMPNVGLSDEEAQALTFLMTCYTAESMPTELLASPRQEIAQMKLPEPLDPLALDGYVGSQFCISCHGATHPQTVQSWRDSLMATTFERIEDEPVLDNCLPCHATGLNAATGHYVEQGVGCEACHGPGREAVRRVLAGKPNEHKQMIRIDHNSTAVCARCHNPHVAIEAHVEFYRKLPPAGWKPVVMQPASEQERPVPTPLQAAALGESQPPAETEIAARPDAQPTVAEPATSIRSVPVGANVALEQVSTSAAQSPPVGPIEAAPTAEEDFHTATRTEKADALTSIGLDVKPLLAVSPIDGYGTISTARPQSVEGGCVSSECHSATALGESIHGPTAQQNCDFCHQLTDERAHRFKMRLDEPDLCFECHDQPPTHPFNHGPVQLGTCTVCHNPHSAPNRFMLLKAGKELCFMCHLDMREQVEGVRVQHEALNENECTVCHDPHASDFARQLKQDMASLCVECHEPVGEIVAHAAFPHGAVTEDDQCANCHEPHGSDMPNILADREVRLCLDCHDEPMDTPHGPIADMKTWLQENPERHGPIREDNCTLCHQPHGSEHFRILTHDFPRKFYSPFSIETYELCFHCHESTLVLDEYTHTLTDFRNGARNLHYLHVNRERGRTCRACHEVHAGTKPKRIKDFVPFGTWMFPVNFELTANGGKCAPGCHLPRAYDRHQAVTHQ